jgi:ribose 5-phosphate isomerase A
MSSSGIAPQATRGAWKFFAAEVAAALVEDGMVVGLGAGSTAAFAVETLARQGLRFVGIPTSERTAEQAKAAGIPLTSFAEHRHIDLTIDGADEVERCTLIEGLGGVLLREKMVAASSRRLAIVVDGAKLVDRLGERTPVPVEVVPFGLKATREAVDVLGATARLASHAGGDPFVTDGGNCASSTAAFRPSPTRRASRTASAASWAWSKAGCSSAVPTWSSAQGVHRLDRARVHRGSPPVLMVMGVSVACKRTTIARELAARLGWAFKAHRHD